jgi:hypothetical protein
MAWERPEELALAAAKKGEPSRNPTGWNNPALRFRKRDFRRELDIIANEECTQHEHKPPMLRRECMARVLWEQAQEGHKWAMHLLLNRWVGRPTLQIDLDVTQQPPLALPNLTNEQLLARLDVLREQIRNEPEIEVASEVIDVPVD